LENKLEVKKEAVSASGWVIFSKALIYYAFGKVTLL